MTEFDDVIRLLRENRPEAGELELDRIKQQVRRRAARPERRQDMKSRLAILLMLVLGMMLSTTGAGIAVQDLTSDDASVAQYGSEDEESPPTVLGEEESGSDVQSTRQVAAGSDGGDELPFTGFLAIPVLLGGVALLSGGLVLRHRTRAPNDE
ncbi:MAG TPA: hypothetical protein VFP78_04595 [Solirubrobacteraceae bacterium]|nr:hypothetical protein [Solirubrobacteraceae bacterium]